MRGLSLYSGMGGLDLAAHLAGIEVAAFCEADPFCRSILARHWPEVPCYESDTLVSGDPGRIDIIFGGPPCQPHSVAGKKQGVDDPRHRWPEMARIVSEFRPAWVVVENVAGFGDVAERFVRPDLESLRYETIRFDIPAAGIGAPHKRERVFIVAYAGSAGHDGGKESSGDVRSDSRGDGGRDAVGNAAQRGRGIVRTETEPDGSRPEPQRTGGARVAESTRELRERHGGARHGGYQPPDGGEGSTKSRLGRDADGLPDWLDSPEWPAPRGRDQYEWEPPRTTTDRENRRKRLKALGNAVVPAQAYPIFAAIAASE